MTATFTFLLGCYAVDRSSRAALLNPHRVRSTKGNFSMYKPSDYTLSLGRQTQLGDNLHYYTIGRLCDGFACRDYSSSQHLERNLKGSGWVSKEWLERVWMWNLPSDVKDGGGALCKSASVDMKLKEYFGRGNICSGPDAEHGGWISRGSVPGS